MFNKVVLEKKNLGLRGFPRFCIFIKISHFEDNVKTDHKTVSVIVTLAIIGNIRNTKKNNFVTVNVLKDSS